MITIAAISEFIGRFHPVLVHLPIGFLLLAVIFSFLSYKGKFEMLKPAVKYSLLFGVLAAIISGISGFLLSQTGDYDESLVSKHQWFGIGLTLVAALAYYFVVKNLVYQKWIMPLIILLTIITGHLGGSLTHGEGYLTKPGSSNDNAGKVVIKPIPDVQQALAYSDIIQPILQARCYNCHGPSKQKGKLRLDDPSFISKGGKEGKIIVAGSSAESELVKRILLPAGNDDHMPPKAKPQLSGQQIELLNWWVSSGADFHKKVGDLNQPVKIKPYLAALQSGEQKPTISNVPEKEVEKAPDSAIHQLLSLDVAINRVSQNSNYLMVNFVTVDAVKTQHLQLLKRLGRQIIWLKMGNTKINDSVLATIGNLTALTRLSLDKTTLTDKGLLYLKNLSQLQYLNLSGTGITVNGLNSLNGLKNLQQLYLYQTTISPEGFLALKKVFPKTVIDTGGYKVEFLQTDTMKVKPNPLKS